MSEASSQVVLERDNISYAFKDLLALERLLDRAASRATPEDDAALRRSGLRLVRRLGGLASRLLLRQLTHGAKPGAPLALHLLERLDSPRVSTEAGRLLRDRALPDAAKLRVLALLSARGEPIPEDATLADPAAVLGEAVEQLLDGLRFAGDHERAAELILAQVPDDELLAFCRAALHHAGDRAVPLLRAMLRRGAMGVKASLSLTRLLAAWEAERQTRPREDDLARGIDLLERRRLPSALRHLRRFVAANPDDLEGRSALGVCLTQAGRAEQALPHLLLCAAAEPTEPLHHWNLAAAAQKLGRVGRCYLALRDYLERGGSADPARREEAERFIAEFEHAVQTAAPGRSPADFAWAEEHAAARTAPRRRTRQRPRQ
jgi:tetratricopeptide (TPR) repeat protein